MNLPPSSGYEPCQYTRQNETHGNIQQQNSWIEYRVIVKTAPLVKNKGPACAGEVVSAGVAFEDGEQAAVGVKMRREQVNGDEDEESHPKTDYEASNHSFLQRYRM